MSYIMLVLYVVVLVNPVVLSLFIIGGNDKFILGLLQCFRL